MRREIHLEQTGRAAGRRKKAEESKRITEEATESVEKNLKIVGSADLLDQNLVARSSMVTLFAARQPPQQFLPQCEENRSLRIPRMMGGGPMSVLTINIRKLSFRV
jgi:hypothetical protein